MSFAVTILSVSVSQSPSCITDEYIHVVPMLQRTKLLSACCSICLFGILYSTHKSAKTYAGIVCVTHDLNF